MIIKNDNVTDAEGNIKSIPRKRPLLSDDAYPCVFDGCPSYLSETMPKFRQSRDEKLTNKENEILEKFMEGDRITDFNNLLTNLEEKIKRENF